MQSLTSKTPSLMHMARLQVKPFSQALIWRLCTVKDSTAASCHHGMRRSCHLKGSGASCKPIPCTKLGGKIPSSWLLSCEVEAAQHEGGRQQAEGTFWDTTGLVPYLSAEFTCQPGIDVVGPSCHRRKSSASMSTQTAIPKPVFSQFALQALTSWTTGAACINYNRNPSQVHYPGGQARPPWEQPATTWSSQNIVALTSCSAGSLDCSSCLLQERCHGIQISKGI